LCIHRAGIARARPIYREHERISPMYALIAVAVVVGAFALLNLIEFRRVD
jgi:hypothetical protein